MSYETILLEKRDHVSVLTLNRPPANSVSYAMLGEIDKESKGKCLWRELENTQQA